MDWINQLGSVRHYVMAGLVLLLAVLASGHALLHKRDSRAALLWVSFIWLAPLLGAILYLLLGINRIKRRAILLRGDLQRYRTQPHVEPCPAAELERQLPEGTKHLSGIAEVLDKMVGRPLVPGNRLIPLINGDAAFPAMLEAIEQARHTITLSTYIFDRDEAGLAFAKALGDAVRRGVEVRVLIDATGTRYSWPPILGRLAHEGVRYARFLPAFRFWRPVSINLRSHRKIMVVDGRVGFTGGMNIRQGNRLSQNPPHPVRDIQFRVEGPVVAHLQEVFVDDWFFSTGEALRGEAWFPALDSVGLVWARGVADGPDEDFERLRWAILGALASARRSVRIVTPYFLPDMAIISALNVAAMRDVEVDIVLPAKSNLPFVQWASTAHWWQILKHGCRIWLTPPPFDHTKIFLVDQCWALVGSTNWDPRSLRLNFEFNVECYDRELAASLERLVQERIGMANQVSLREVDERWIAVKLRDSMARLLSPFL